MAVAHGIGKRFKHATLAQVNKKWFKTIFTYAENHQKYLKRGEGILLSGPQGIGKTYAMVALMKYLKEKLGSQFDYYIITAPRLFDIYADYRAGREEEPDRRKTWDRVFEDIEGMVINDLGKEDRIRDETAQRAIYKLGRILRARHEDARPIFLTTNFPLVPSKQEDVLTFQQAYGGSIWSLVQDMTRFREELQAPDLRAKKADRDLADEED